MSDVKPFISVDGEALAATEQTLLEINAKQTVAEANEDNTVTIGGKKYPTRGIKIDFNAVDEALTKFYKARGQRYVKKEHRNVVKYTCIFCSLKKEHVNEYKRLPKGWLTEHAIIEGYYRHESRVMNSVSANNTLVVGLRRAQKKCKRVEVVRNGMRYVDNDAEWYELEAEIDYLERDSDELRASLVPHFARKEQAESDLMRLELTINGVI